MSKIIKYSLMQEEPMVITSKMQVAVDSIDVPVIHDVRDSAKNEAENILTQAKMDAEQCLIEAKQQVATLRQQAHDEGHKLGHQEGYQEGVKQGQQAGRRELQQTIDQAIEKNREMLTVAEETVKTMMLAAEKQIVDIALAVARKILAYEIAENPVVVLPLVKAALQKVCDQEEIVIRVSHDDFDGLLLAKKDLQTIVGREHALKITADSTIESGSCVIDTSYGTVDARIDTQFETIRKALQGVA